MRGLIHLIVPLILIPGTETTAPLLHLLGHPSLAEPCLGRLGVHGWPQVDDEGEDVEGKDESDEPLDDGGRVLFLLEGACGEGDGET